MELHLHADVDVPLTVIIESKKRRRRPNGSSARPVTTMAETAATADLARRATERLRLPPHSLEAEQSLLGGLMLDQRAWDQIADVSGPRTCIAPITV